MFHTSVALCVAHTHTRPAPPMPQSTFLLATKQFVTKKSWGQSRLTATPRDGTETRSAPSPPRLNESVHVRGGTPPFCSYTGKGGTNQLHLLFLRTETPLHTLGVPSTTITSTTIITITREEKKSQGGRNKSRRPRSTDGARRTAQVCISSNSFAHVKPLHLGVFGDDLYFACQGQEEGCVAEMGLLAVSQWFPPERQKKKLRTWLFIPWCTCPCKETLQ